MPIFLRKIIMWLFIIAFLIITPLVILSASGWSYNWKKNCFEQSGVLMIDIEPKTSTIFVNNRELKQLFPFSAFHLDDLNPGEYNIKIEKEDYHSWEKTVEVKATLTTFIDRMQLWPISTAENISKENIDKWFYLNNQYSIYTIKNESYLEFWLFNNENESQKLIYRLLDLQITDEIIKDNFKYSANNKFISFQNNTENIIFNLLKEEDSKNLNTLYPKIKIQNLHWDKNNDNTLYISDTESNIYKVNINKNESLTLFDKLNEKFIDFYIVDNYIYYINEEKIFKRSEIDEKTTEEIVNLKNEEYQIQGIDKEHWFIHNTDHSYFFQLYDNKIYYQIIPSSEIAFSTDHKKLAYINPKQFEILTLEKFRDQAETAETYLLNRYSELAENLIWYENNEYLFYQINNEVNVIELDGRGNNRNINNLYTSPNELKGFSIDTKNENLYVANEDGIYKLEIVE